MKAGECKSCGARIVWARTASGKAMPLDADQVADGITVDDAGAITGYHVPVYASHFATCPNAAKHRRGGR